MLHPDGGHQGGGCRWSTECGVQARLGRFKCCQLSSGEGTPWGNKSLLETELRILGHSIFRYSKRCGKSSLAPKFTSYKKVLEISTQLPISIHTICKTSYFQSNVNYRRVCRHHLSQGTLSRDRGWSAGWCHWQIGMPMLRDTENLASGKQPFISSEKWSVVTSMVKFQELHVLTLRIYRRARAEFKGFKSRWSHSRRVWYCPSCLETIAPQGSIRPCLSASKSFPSTLTWCLWLWSDDLQAYDMS